MGNLVKPFKHRAFVAMVMVFSGLALPVTGIGTHFYGFAPLSVGRHAWMSAHNALGILFDVFSIWHVVLNRKALWSHVKNAAAHAPIVNREVLLTGAVFAVILALFVGHALHAGH